MSIMTVTFGTRGGLFFMYSRIKVTTIAIMLKTSYIKTTIQVIAEFWFDFS